MKFHKKSTACYKPLLALPIRDKTMTLNLSRDLQYERSSKNRMMRDVLKKIDPFLSVAAVYTSNMVTKEKLNRIRIDISRCLRD